MECKRYDHIHFAGNWNVYTCQELVKFDNNFWLCSCYGDTRGCHWKRTTGETSPETNMSCSRQHPLIKNGWVGFTPEVNK